MCRDEGVHEGLEVRSPPLRQTIANLPIAGLLALAQPTDRGQPLVQPRFEAVDLLVLGSQVVARELEEGVRNLEHQDVRVVVLMADEDALARAAHAMDIVVLLESLQSRNDRWVLLGLRLLDAERVVGERVQADCLGLVSIEGKGDDGWVGGLKRRRRYCRHLGLLTICLSAMLCVFLE